LSSWNLHGEAIGARLPPGFCQIALRCFAWLPVPITEDRHPIFGSPNFLVNGTKMNEKDEKTGGKEEGTQHLDRMEQTLPQQLKSCTAVHHALGRL
jgi:hypothetical protein